MKTWINKFYDPSLARVQLSGETISLPKIFFPILVELVLMNLMNTVNTLMLSNYSDNAVAAVGTAGQCMTMILTMFSVISNGSSIVIGQKLGAEKDKSAFETAQCSIVFVLLLSVIVSTLFARNAASVMSFMNLTGDVHTQAVLYFKITAQFCCFAGINTCLFAIFRCYGRPKLSVAVNLFMNFLNAFLNYLVIFKHVSFLPEGVEGVAVSYAIAQVVGLIITVVLFAKHFRYQKFSFKNSVTLSNLFQVLRFGVPSGVANLSYNISQVVTTSIIATLGMAMISTKTYVTTVVFYVYVVGLALGQSTSLMISWLTGSGKYEHAYRLNLQNLRLTICVNGSISLIVFLLGKNLIGIFTDDPLILKTASLILLFDIGVEIFRGFNHIEENSLRGAGDVYVPMVTAMCSCWCISVFLGYILSVKLGFGLYGCWLAFALDEMCRGCIYLWRWRSKKWMKQGI